MKPKEEETEVTLNIDGKRFFYVFTWCMLVLMLGFTVYTIYNIVDTINNNSLDLARSHNYNKATQALDAGLCEGFNLDCVYLETKEYREENRAIINAYENVLPIICNVAGLFFIMCVTMLSIFAHREIETRGKK